VNGSVASPALQLRTLYLLDDRGRIRGTREPGAGPGPHFALIRGQSDCVWATRVDVPEHDHTEFVALVSTEPPLTDFHQPPVHAERYRELVRGAASVVSAPSLTEFHGAAFAFPSDLALPCDEDTSLVDDEARLHHHFTGWQPGEIALGRAPVVALMRAGHPVSIAFCARRSTVAAEAGVETAPAFRGQGFATRVVAEWARRVRAEGLLPLYSAAWNNAASLAVARKLGLVMYANDWNVSPAKQGCEPSVTFGARRVPNRPRAASDADRPGRR
jgi:GNAT superfamily N-acetyltransferase